MWRSKQFAHFFGLCSFVLPFCLFFLCQSRQCPSRNFWLALLGSCVGCFKLQLGAGPRLCHSWRLYVPLSQTKKGIGQQMRDASFSLAQATYAAGGKFKTRLQNKIQQARIRVRVSQVYPDGRHRFMWSRCDKSVIPSQDNVAGVRLPIFQQVADQEAEEVSAECFISQGARSFGYLLPEHA